MTPPRPRAFRLDAQVQERIEELPDAFAPPALDAAEADVERALAPRIWGWGAVLASATGGLVTLALGLWLAQVVEGLFAQVPALGWLGLALAAAAGLAALVLLGREIFAIARQQRIAKLHIAFAQARAGDDRPAARALVRDLAALYAARPGTAAARAELAKYAGEIIDGRDLIDLAERALMSALDGHARRAIAQAAKRVSLVTALSPRALFDVLFVAAQAVWLLRTIAGIYGGRPGLLGFFKLARSVGAHLAITGGMAAGDSIVQQLLGYGIAAKLSARLGEGVLNGLLTARVGLAAMAVCRPMPFAVAPAPGVRDVAPELFAGKVA